MKWYKTARVKMVELVVRLGSIVGSQRAFRLETGSRAAPDPHTLRWWVERFRAKGSVARKPNTQRRPRRGQDVGKIQGLIRRNPRLSLRRLARRTGIPKSTVRGVLRKRLQLYPYKLQLLTRLRRGDKAKRIRACSWRTCGSVFQETLSAQHIFVALAFYSCVTVFPQENLSA